MKPVSFVANGAKSILISICIQGRMNAVVLLSGVRMAQLGYLSVVEVGVHVGAVPVVLVHASDGFSISR